MNDRSTRIRILMALLAVFGISQASWADHHAPAPQHVPDGIITLASNHSVAQTIKRLENSVRAKGMNVFAKIDHAAGAQSIGETLSPSQLLIFGNPKVGTKLMQCDPLVGLDLPMKALAWQDKKGKVWLSYNSPSYLKQRHRIPGCGKVMAKVGQALRNFAQEATKP